MKTIFSRVIRFFWSWGFLKFVLIVAALVILFYIEEDWRGASMWAATKAKWEAQGESFDYKKFIPPPIPDDQNLAALPIFEVKEGRTTDLFERAVQKQVMPQLMAAMHDGVAGVDIPSSGNVTTGKPPDLAAINATLQKSYEAVFPGKPAPPDALAKLDALYPFIDDLRAAVRTHPFYRLKVDYDADLPIMRQWWPVTKSITLCKLLTLHANLALDQKQPDIAFGDIQVGLAMVRGTQKDPSLVGGLVTLGDWAILQATIYSGLVTHGWNDEQLVELDRMLGSIDFLGGFQLAMRAENTISQASIRSQKKDGRNSPMYAKLHDLGFDEDEKTDLSKIVWLDGWLDDNARQFADFYLSEVAAVDPRSRIVFVKNADALSEAVKSRKASWTSILQANILFVSCARPISRALLSFARAQVLLDETRIACALERYRLAKGTYPTSLDALAPAYIDAMPHDIMNGQPYQYRLNDDGSFRLYSVGWNQIDEGGTVVFETDSPSIPSYEHGDWVWPGVR
jgi:hypothetical protein